MHILITGGAGFIGSNLVAYHMECGDKVHVVDDLSTGRIENIASFINHPDFTFEQADLLLWDALDNVVNWADRIYHMAAVVGLFRVLQEPVSVLRTNIMGTQKLLSALHKSHWKPKLIIASTSEVYGNHHENIALHEEIELLVTPGHNSRWNYAISKLADEAFALSYVHEYGADITIVRFFNVIGLNQSGKYGMVVPRFIAQATANEPITIYGDGSQVRSFMDVRDCIGMLQILAKNKQTKGEIVNVGTDHERNITDLATMIKARAQSSSEIVYVSYNDAYGAGFEDYFHRKPDLTKLQRLTNYHPQWSLEDTVDFLIKNRQLKDA
jgi:UDP-glucose 4-epimerase